MKQRTLKTLASHKAFLKVTHSEGREALESALHYIKQQKKSTSREVMLIKKRRDYASQESNKVFKIKANIFF
jgi:hypothetical protein